MGILGSIIIGLIAGLLASKLLGSKHGIIMNTILGIIGGALGGWLFGLIGIEASSGWIGQIITGLVGAVVILWIAKLLR